MASVYVHLSGKNTDNAILKVYGKVIEETVKGGVLMPIQCLRCKTGNESTNKFCKLCGLPLDEVTQRNLLTEEFRHKEANRLMDSLLKDDKVVKLLMSKLKQTQ